MAEVAEDSVITNEKTKEQHVDGTANSALSINNDSVKTEVVDTSYGSGNHVVPDTTIVTVKDGEDTSVTKEMVSDSDVLNATEDCRIRVANNEHQSGSMKMEEDDHDFLSEDFMDNLDVVDSWVDTTDNIESPCNELNATTDPVTSQAADAVHFDTKEVDKKDSEEHNIKQDKTKSNDNVSNEKSSRRASQDKKIEKDGKSTERNNMQDKKTVGKEANDKSRNRNSDRTGKSPDRTLRRDHNNRREKSPNRSNKSSDNSKRNTERSVDRGNTSLSSRTRRNSRARRSRTRSKERDEHYNSRKNQGKERNSQRSGDLEHRTSRTTNSYQKQDRSVDRDKRSVKSRSSTGKEVTKPNTASTGKGADSNPLMFKKIPPLVEVLVPPGTEDDDVTKVDEKFTAHFLNADALVPPGTVEVLLPDVLDQNSSSSKKRKASNPDVNKSKLKSGTEGVNSQNDKDKRGTEKRRRIDDIVRKKQPLVTKKGERELTGRERIARDQDRISRELSLERLRESRNRDRDRYPNRDRYSQSYRSRDERERRSGSFERRSSHDSRWETSGRDRYERRTGELSPVSPGRMSRGSPMSFEFSPVSSRSSSRERLKLEYQRGKFRSYSPISSGSNLSRSMVSISSDEERDPRSSRRRRRLPFLDEMERKLGLKLTGGHNINQQLRASQQFPTDFNPGIDVSAPPPGTYPVGYPPLVSYATPFPQAVNPMYPTPAPTFIPIPPISTEPPVVRPTGPPPVTAPANPSPSSQLERQLVRPPREPLNITYKFQRPVQNEQPECLKAPPPPTISGGVAKGEMSLSSLLEASVKGTLEATKATEAQRSTEVGGKNPVDEARVQRCQVAIQTLQEDESFSMITMGRFIVQPAASTASYSLVARFDHPAQESMFKLKSPLLRNRPVGLAFTTPPPAPAPALTPAPLPKPSSVWPKNSEKKPAPAPETREEPETGEDPESKEDPEDPDVWIVERTETVVSISSDSDHDLNLSPVSDVSDVDKLENVSSGEEDFNQCPTCAERSRDKKTATVATQSRFVPKRSVNLQVDLVGQQLVGSCDVAPRPARRRKKKQGIHSNTSSVSSCSSNDTSPDSPSNQTLSSTPNKPRPLVNTFPVSTTTRPTAKSFLASVTDQPLVGCTDQLYSNLPAVGSTNKSPSNQSLTSSYNPFSSTTNKFSNKSLYNQTPISQPKTGSNSSDIDPNNSFQANKSLSSLHSSSAPGLGYKSSGPFRTENAIKLTTINSGTVMGILSKPAPTRGILKMPRSADNQSTPAPNTETPAANDFQPSKFLVPNPFHGGSVTKQQPPYTNQNTKNQQAMVMPLSFGGNMSQQQQLFRNQSNPNKQQSFQSGSVQRQPFLGNTNKQAGGQSFQSGSVQRQPFLGNTNKQAGQTGDMQRQPFVGSTNNQNQQVIGGQPFQGGSMQRQPFVGNVNNQTQPGIGGAPLQPYGLFAPPTMNTNFGNRFSNVPTMVPPPTPVPIPAYNQQNFQRPSEGLGINSGPTGANSNQRQTYFNSPIGQQGNLYDRERY